jgi:hypothetical protein
MNFSDTSATGCRTLELRYEINFCAGTDAIKLFRIHFIALDISEDGLYE